MGLGLGVGLGSGFALAPTLSPGAGVRVGVRVRVRLGSGFALAPTLSPSAEETKARSRRCCDATWRSSRRSTAASYLVRLRARARVRVGVRVRVGARNRPTVIGLDLESRGLCGGGWLRLGTRCLSPLRAIAQQAL